MNHPCYRYKSNNFNARKVGFNKDKTVGNNNIKFVALKPKELSFTTCKLSLYNEEVKKFKFLNSKKNLS